MFLGRLSDLAEQKAVLPQAIIRGLNALESVDLTTVAPGRYEVEGDRMFYTIAPGTTEPVAARKVEAHAAYADVQLLVSGEERYGFSFAEPGLVPTEDRLGSDDNAFFPTPTAETFIDLYPGMFLVFLPGEMHRPLCAVTQSAPLRKVIIKVHRSLLGM